MDDELAKPLTQRGEIIVEMEKLFYYTPSGKLGITKNRIATLHELVIKLANLERYS